ncbi:CCD42 protein, partial [Turnix velox]|nr:CCD42 protein [Turnix velox]
MPTWDTSTLLPNTRLLRKRRELAEVEQTLQSKQKEFVQRMEHLAQRRQQLVQRKEQLQHLTLKFNAFLKVSGMRQERELRRVEEVRARADRQEAESSRLHRELERLLELRESLARRLRSLRGFEDYLQGVLAVTEQFQDIPAMLAHFGTLEATWATLAEEAEAKQEQLAQGWARLQQYQEEASSELLSTKDELRRLQERLEVAHQRVLQEESRWAYVQSTGAQKTQLLGQIKLAVLNLFQLATSRLQIPKDVALEDTTAQLDMVSVAL